MWGYSYIGGEWVEATWYPLPIGYRVLISVLIHYGMMGRVSGSVELCQLYATVLMAIVASELVVYVCGMIDDMI